MSRTENQTFLAPPADARAALFFLEGQYQLNWREGSIERTKFLTPAQIGKAFAVKDVFDSGWLGISVLRFALLAKKKQKILSVLTAGRRKIFITDPRSAAEREAAGVDASDQVLELEIPLPTLLLLGCGNNYYLWATLERKIGENAKICAAPFPNLDKSGAICFGKNFAPECRLETIGNVWQMILDSPFNNHQTANRCRTEPDDARKLLLALRGKRSFPKNALIQTRHTVANLWHSAG